MTLALMHTYNRAKTAEHVSFTPIKGLSSVLAVLKVKNEPKANRNQQKEIYGHHIEKTEFHQNSSTIRHAVLLTTCQMF